MALTDALIESDIDFMFTDLAGTGAVETVSRIPAGATLAERTFSVIRAKQRSAEELMSTGFATLYRFSFYAKRGDIGETEQGDVIVMANGDRLRVFRLVEQPARVVIMFDVGDEFEDGGDLD